ncbi:hypothetical protein B0H14DRAFT_3533375 [Mycena olivaceomarginata]|nr:hypothetical protein B0H14DRAFT_3533375 [Mycena olivaceomarginata]
MIQTRTDDEKQQSTTRATSSARPKKIPSTQDQLYTYTKLAKLALPTDSPHKSPQKRKTFRPNQHSPDDAFGDAGGSGTLDTSTGEIFNLAGSAASEGGEDSEGENDAARNTSPTPGTPDSDAVLAPLASTTDEEMHPAPPAYNAANSATCRPRTALRAAAPSRAATSTSATEPPRPNTRPPVAQQAPPRRPNARRTAATTQRTPTALWCAPSPFGRRPLCLGPPSRCSMPPYSNLRPPSSNLPAGGQPPAPQQQPPAVFALPSVAQLAAMQVEARARNPQLQMQPAQPIPPVNADGAAYYQHNAGQFHRHVITNKQILRHIPELQLTEYNESPHNRLAIVLANAGNHVLRRVQYATPLEQQIREVLRALIPDGSITVNMPSLDETLQNTGGTRKQTFGVHPSLAFWVHDLAANEAIRAWALAQWSVAGAGGDDDGGKRAAAYARAALITLAFRNPAIFQMIDQHTQGKGGPASQRVYDALNTIHGELLENPDLPNKPVLTLFMEPTTDNEEEQENLMHLLRIIPLNASYYTFTPMSKTGEPPECAEGEEVALQAAVVETTAAAETVEAAENGRGGGGGAGEVVDAEADRPTHPMAADTTEPPAGEAEAGMAAAAASAATEADADAEVAGVTPKALTLKAFVARDTEHEGLQGQQNSNNNDGE